MLSLKREEMLCTILRFAALSPYKKDVSHTFFNNFVKCVLSQKMPILNFHGSLSYQHLRQVTPSLSQEMSGVWEDQTLSVVEFKSYLLTCH